MLETGDLRQQAIGRLKDRRELQAHLLAYVLVTGSLVVVWLMTGPTWLFWPGFVLLGWGIGLVFHAWNYFYGTRYSEAAIQREMQHLEGGGSTG